MKQQVELPILDRLLILHKAALQSHLQSLSSSAVRSFKKSYGDAEQNLVRSSKTQPLKFRPLILTKDRCA